MVVCRRLFCLLFIFLFINAPQASAKIYEFSLGDDFIILSAESAELLNSSELENLARILVDLECSKQKCGPLPCNRAETFTVIKKNAKGRIRLLSPGWLELAEGAHLFLTQLGCVSDVSPELSLGEAKRITAVASILPRVLMGRGGLENQCQTGLSKFKPIHSTSGGVDVERRLEEAKSFRELSEIFTAAEERNHEDFLVLKAQWIERLKEEVKTLDLKNFKFSEGSTKTGYLLNAQGAPVRSTRDAALIVLTPREESSLMDSILRKEVSSLKKIKGAGLPVVTLVEGTTDFPIFTLKNGHPAIIEEYISNSMSFDLKRSGSGLTRVDKLILYSAIVGKVISTSEAGVAFSSAVLLDSITGPKSAQIMGSIDNLLSQFQKIAKFKDKIIDLQIQIQPTSIDQFSQIKIIDPLDIVTVLDERKMVESDPELVMKIGETDQWLSQMIDYLGVLKKSSDPVKDIQEELHRGVRPSSAPPVLVRPLNAAQEKLRRDAAAAERRRKGTPDQTSLPGSRLK